MEGKAVLGVMLTMLLAAMLALTLKVRPIDAAGTIYIRADGSVDPPTAPISTVDNATYTLTGNINDWIVIERNNIIIDGNGFTLQGIGTGEGVFLSGTNNVTVQNMDIKGFHRGVYLESASNNSVSGNMITANKYGIVVSGSSDYNSINQNEVKANTNSGIWLLSSNNSVSGNTLTANNYGIRLYESSGNVIYHNNFIDNTNQIFDFSWADPRLAPSINVWDYGYPSGGNFWSNHDGKDFHGGPYQNETGMDGIVDMPYIIDPNNTDNYPITHSYGSIRNLDTDLTYLTIQSAIDADETLDGHTIYVSSGTYWEHIVLDKALVLAGENSGTTIIDGNGTGTVVYVTADWASISGFAIQNGGSAWPSAGILLINSFGSIVSGNNIENNFPQAGILLRFSQNVSIYGNTLTNNDKGIWLVSCSNSTIEGNAASENWRGIWLHDSRYNQVVDNIASNNYYDGIVLYNESDTNIIYGNTVMGNNGSGIKLENSNGTGSIIKGNMIIDNNIGVGIYSSQGNTIFHNNLINNTLQMYEYGAPTDNSWDNGFEGNYWSDYNGTDTSTPFDGIGDTYLPWQGVDYYPLMNPYWNPADINHDLKVDIRDIAAAALAFGSQPGDFNWNPHVDLTGPEHLVPDGKVDIRDIALIAFDFGKRYT